MDSAGQLQALPAGIAIIPVGVNDPLNAYQLSTANIVLTDTAASIYGLALNQNSNGRTLTLADNGTLTLNGIISIQASNTASINAGAGTSNLIIGSERNLVINMDNGGHLTINAPIADSGGGASSVTTTSTMPGTAVPGNVILAGDNTFSGGLIATGRGLLRLNHSNAAGTGTITLASSQTGTAGTFVITINDNGGFIILNNAGASGTTFTVGGATPNSTTITAATYSSQISFRSSTDTTRLGVLNSRINAPNADFNGNNFGNWTINSTGNIWRVTSLTNTSRFVLGATDALATGAHILLSGTGFVDLNGFNQTVAGLGGSSASGSILNNSATTDSTLTLAGLTADQSFIGAIEDGPTNKVSLVVNNANAFTQTLAGTNTYSGATTVSAGSLYVTGALSNSAVTVETNGTIGSNGGLGSRELGNGLTILAGGNLDLTGATLGLNSADILSIKGGSLTLANLTFEDLIGWDWAKADAGTYELIDGTFSVDFGSTAFISETTAYDFGNGKKGYFTSGSLNVVIIPEPGSAALGAFGALLLLRRRR